MLLMCLEWHADSTECQRSLHAALPGLLSGCFISICQPVDKSGGFRSITCLHTTCLIGAARCPDMTSWELLFFLQPVPFFITPWKPGNLGVCTPPSHFTFAARKLRFCHIFLKLAPERRSKKVSQWRAIIQHISRDEMHYYVPGDIRFYWKWVWGCSWYEISLFVTSLILPSG